MPVFEQGYRRYEGELDRGSPILPMAWMAFRTRMRWWVWVLVIVLLFYPHLVYGVLVFVATLGQSLIGTGPVGTGAQQTIAYQELDTLNPAAMLVAVQTGSLSLFWKVLNDASLANLVVPAVACGGILSSDRSSGAMQIYFARPVTRFQYLASKILATCGFSALVTALPLLVLWAACAAFSADPEYLLKTWAAVPAILGGSAIYALWAAALVLGLSSFLRRPVLASTGAIFLYLLARGLAEPVAATAQNKAWLVIAPYYSLGGLTAPLFGLELPDWLATPWLVGTSVGLPVAFFALVWWRLKAVEVAT